jgi:hypothetical protein
MAASFFAVQEGKEMKFKFFHNSINVLDLEKSLHFYQEPWG